METWKDEELLKFIKSWRERGNFTTGEAALAEAIERLLHKKENLCEPKRETA